MNRLIALATLLVAMIAPSTVVAQCVNTASPTCGVYEQCFADRCDCNGRPEEYFLTYGKKYCEKFLDLPGLSPEGKSWRNSTLRCLQESIVPRLPADGAAKQCDCKAMQVIAFDSHVACYTKPGKSICALPMSDWHAIFKAVDPLANTIDKKGMKQMMTVFGICLSELPDDAKAEARRLIEKYGR